MKCLGSLSKFLVQVSCLSFSLISESSSSLHCSREGSRLVRKVLEKNFYPIFDLHGVNTSEECPLKRSRDLYHIQEAYKQFEHNARWSCEACGKAFYKQEFLDLHMENKHQDFLVKEEFSPICLADYCQMFRCEAVRREKRNKHFWSKALCNAEKMAKQKKKCLHLIQSCIPTQETPELYQQIYNEITEETCSLINCKDYWKPLHYELSPFEVLYYLTFTPILILALGIYYYNIWEHYYGDEPEQRAVSESQSGPSNDNNLPGLRKRYGNSRFEY
ncbi:uncharacterized protein LOC114532652 [Dendronephthya gigantea]|uniref:uncharacterized protein LOC114532652 n=1 Tax=Dendronephthya gigantea TaxID=151771 RepID=UPI00106D2FAA|nr:uncharacterized protein LOC114532652 [Dendronephthya gigantea]